MPEIVTAGDIAQAQKAWLGIISAGKIPRPMGNGGGMDDQGDAVLLRLDGSLADIRCINAADRQVTVGCGISIAELEMELASVGLCFPARVHDPAKVTLDGWLGVGMPGCKGRIHPARRLLAATVLTPQGRLIHSGAATAKDVAGYDFHRPMVGAFGRLGMLLQVTLAVDAKPAHAQLLRATAADPLKMFAELEKCKTVERMFVRIASNNGLLMMIEQSGDPAAIELDMQMLRKIMPDCELPKGDVSQLWRMELTEAFSDHGFYLRCTLPVGMAFGGVAGSDWWGNPWEGTLWRYVGTNKPPDALPANQMLFERKADGLFPHPGPNPKWAVSYLSTV
jgi:hypothetical protein